MYTITFDTETIEFLSKLPPKMKERIFNKIISIKENPFSISFFGLRKNLRDQPYLLCIPFRNPYRIVFLYFSSFRLV